MPAITALLHTHNDALRLGRALETLYPCDEILIVDHASRDGTPDVARQYGAMIMDASSGTLVRDHFAPGPSRWILCLDPRESLTEALAASLFEWKTEAEPAQGRTFSVFLREETAGGWVANLDAQTRLVPSTSGQWEHGIPKHDPAAVPLQGELLRFVLP